MNTRSFSQNGQDIQILKLLNYKRNGYFLDIGCAHFRQISNTFALERSFDWNGLCVDPRKGLQNGFKEKRKCFFKEAAVYSYTGKISFRDIGVLSGVADETITDECPAQRLSSQKFYEVDCITFEDLFREYNVPPIIDYMSLDVEGAEFLILETFPFSKYTLMTATIEHNSHLGPRQKEKGQKILKLMEDNGFELISNTKQDFIMANKKLVLG
jgi:FkbM family methyltransferase